VNSPELIPWNDADTEQMISLIERGYPAAAIAPALGRSEEDVIERARFLGVQLPAQKETGLLTRTVDSSSKGSSIRYVPFRSRSVET
jgi:hypothetical protein